MALSRILRASARVVGALLISHWKRTRPGPACSMVSTLPGAITSLLTTLFSGSFGSVSFCENSVSSLTLLRVVGLKTPSGCVSLTTPTTTTSYSENSFLTWSWKIRTASCSDSMFSGSVSTRTILIMAPSIRVASTIIAMTNLGFLIEN